MKKSKSKILVVDDNEEILVALRLFLLEHFDLITTEKNPIQIPYLVQKENYDVILLDMNFKAGVNIGNEGIYWMKEILGQDPSAVIVFMTAYADIELAVKAIKMGAADFIEKPWDDDKLLATLLSAQQLRKSKLEIKSLKTKQRHLSDKINKEFELVIGSSPAMQSIMTTVSKVARTDANILILGENGTGKELIAREIHRQSSLGNEVFVSVDMAAITETLFESELFGHTKGAFTDAKEDRAGRFEIASGGTLFLDEIGNLSLPMQAKILTALQNREIFRLGSNMPVPIDIRLISATNKNLQEMTADNAFREDLLYRINTIQVALPPLRERVEDIPVLTEFFLKKYTQKYKKPTLKVSQTALNKLRKYPWPGNVRELQHTIEKATILCESDIISEDDFFFQTPRRPASGAPETLNIEENEKRLIRLAIQKNVGNLTRAAGELGITRKTLYNKLEKYGL